MEETATEVPPVHYTTSQLVKMVMDKTGMPCKSRNRSALLKKLGLPAEKSDPARNPVKTKAPTVRQQAKARAKAGVKAAKDKRAAKKAKPAKAKSTVVRSAKKAKPAKAKSTVVRSDKKAKPAKAKPTTVRSDKERHAKALAAVKAAMSRREPPSLRALCAELTERGIEKPRGGTDWMPSSIQSLMRQAGFAAGGLPGKE